MTPGTGLKFELADNDGTWTELSFTREGHVLRENVVFEV